MRARQKAREFFPTPFFLDFVRKRGCRKTHFSKMRPCVRPSVQKPIALESVDFASPKLRGSKKRQISLLRQKSRYLLSKLFSFFCEIHSSRISCCVTPTGANKYFNAARSGYSNPKEGRDGTPNHLPTRCSHTIDFP